MIALKITEIGTFINKLLKDGMCDHFLLQEAVITQAATYTIDGSFHPDYYEPEEPGKDYHTFRHRFYIQRHQRYVCAFHL